MSELEERIKKHFARVGRLLEEEKREKHIEKKGKIMIVDDDEQVLSALKRKLGKLGYEILTAENGYDAKEVYNLNPNIDVAIIDMMMDGLSGEETNEFLKETNEDLPIIYYTAFPQHYKKEDLRVGFSCYVEKNISDFSVLYRSISDCVEKRKELHKKKEELIQKGIKTGLIKDGKKPLPRILKNIEKEHLTNEETSIGHDVINISNLDLSSGIYTELKKNPKVYNFFLARESFPLSFDLVAMSDDSNLNHITDLEFFFRNHFNKNIRVISAPRQEILNNLNKLYAKDDRDEEALSMKKMQVDIFDLSYGDPKIYYSKPPEEVPKFLDAVIHHGIMEKAHDIQFINDMKDNKVVTGIHYVRDGVVGKSSLPYLREMPVEKYIHLLTILKTKTKNTIYDRSRRQDGSAGILFTGEMGKERGMMRVSYVPSAHEYGYITVQDTSIRLIIKSHLPASIDELGFTDYIQKNYMKIISGIDEGLIISLGPTGHGKSTTIQAALRAINHDGVNKIIKALQDPVEMLIPHITQIPISKRTGDFADNLKGVLRQNPDIVYIGEIRDKETAKIAVEAGLSGHAVFTTMHGRSITNVIGRLSRYTNSHDTGESLSAVITQKLIRLIHQGCRVEADLGEYSNHLSSGPYGFSIQEIEANMLGGKMPKGMFYYGKGCKECNYTGFRGRVPIAQLVILDPELRGLISEKDNGGFVKMSYEKGFKPLIADGLDLVFKKQITTLDEIYSKTGEIDKFEFKKWLKMNISSNDYLS